MHSAEADLRLGPDWTFLAPGLRLRRPADRRVPVRRGVRQEQPRLAIERSVEQVPMVLVDGREDELSGIPIIAFAARHDPTLGVGDHRHVQPVASVAEQVPWLLRSRPARSVPPIDRPFTKACLDRLAVWLEVSVKVSKRPLAYEYNHTVRSAVVAERIRARGRPSKAIARA